MYHCIVEDIVTIINAVKNLVDATEEETAGNPLLHHCHQRSKKPVDTMGNTDGNQRAIHLYTTIINAVKKLVVAMGDTEDESEGDPFVHEHHRCSEKTSGRNIRKRWESGEIHLCTTIIDAVKILVDEMGNTEGESGVIHLYTTIVDEQGKTSGRSGRHRR